MFKKVLVLVGILVIGVVLAFGCNGIQKATSVINPHTTIVPTPIKFADGTVILPPGSIPERPMPIKFADGTVILPPGSIPNK